MTEHSQRAFAARIRQPHAQALLPGVPAERMALYETLFFNNIAGFIDSGFPVLRRLFDEQRWQRLLRAFIAGHRCRTPYFLQIGEEFIAWLQHGYRAEAGDPPFLVELAHYEWVELALDVASAELPAQGWSPLAWPLAYVWPVQQLGADCRPSVPPAEPTCLLAWRDDADQVRFQQLSTFAYRLALRLQAGEGSTSALLELATESGLAADKHYFTQARALLEEWQRQAIWFPAHD
ncbi:HvfC family RiPP maturation protein [Aquipseudomonas ullengensis]|uniref:Putative DNA-binding domain-containing protein n=1 Tax=Aquipseudomonas ullengensis TaxID=2759166 RepID=A0A7W4LL31_9GAMM|nr:putative DNA-binding domain-containing protein [Pseudomonas ullengensis]MBB2494932.1 putative DNA-binding domain-containing protein [Pseudomonas ullengensis]